MMIWCWLALAGALGVLARFLLSSAIPPASPGHLPIGVLTTNVIGCALFGLVVKMGGAGGWLAPQVQTVLLVGFLGAFTTFSSYAFEVVVLAEAGRIGLATLHVFVHNATGIAGMLLGMAAAGWLPERV